MHAQLLQLIDSPRSAYKCTLNAFLAYKSDMWKIGTQRGSTGSPALINPYLPAFDSLALYSLIRMNKPQLYLEIGSGHSTRFARRAVEDGQLSTRIVSVDPQPRVDIRRIADRVIQQPVEEMALDIFESLQSGDILFVDNSHRVFTNSDTAVVFLDVLPRLKPGVLVHFHDIFLPADYPPEWNDRYYSEQYMLACHLLARTQTFDIVLANAFASRDSELSLILADLWENRAMDGVDRTGSSFWVRISEATAASSISDRQH